MLRLYDGTISFPFDRLQEKHVKEKQCQHQRNIIELQDKLKKNQIAVSRFSSFQSAIVLIIIENFK